MPDDQQYRLVAVHSNVDRLSASTVHKLFVDMVYRSVHAGEDWLRIVVPKGRSLRMERAIGVSEPHDEGDLTTAVLGIPHITEVDSSRGVPYFPGEQNAGDYPLFTDRGTGLFGPAHAPIYGRRGPMRFEDAGGNVLFRSQVAGQPAKHFMLDTYEQLRRIALPMEADRFRERVQHLYDDPDPAL